MNSYSLYIHIPWCIEKCPYCDFNSHAIRQAVDETAYLKALLNDFNQELNDISGRLLTSIFIGGGTPSTLSPDFYVKLLAQLQQLTGFDEKIEITLEANPGTADASYFRGYLEAGINRLSMGFQSLQNEKLQQLGRIHDAAQAIKAFEIARAAGFDNINIDLMFALPGQSVEQALSDLHQATKLQPEHLSWYQLTLEPNTAFFANPPAGIPDEDLSWAIQTAGQEWLKKQGYWQYEISAYCRDERQCRHNLNYWRFGDYVGIGAGAHGKLTLADGSVVRRSKRRHPAEYLQGQYLSQENLLSGQDLTLEFMMNRLRLREGFTMQKLYDQTGLSAATTGQLADKLQQAQSKKLLEYNQGSYFVTELGHRFLNDLISIFL